MIDLALSIGDGMNQRIINLLFLVVQCRTVFKGIPGRSFLAKLDIVTSTFHLKIAYHDEKGAPITIKEDLREARRMKMEICKGILTLALKNSNDLDLNMCEDEIRPTPNSEFEFVQLGYNPNSSF